MTHDSHAFQPNHSSTVDFRVSPLQATSLPPIIPKLGKPEIQECKSELEMEHFIAARDSLPSHLLGFLSLYTKIEYQRNNARLFLTTDHGGGFAMIGTQLCSVFSYPCKHYGDLLIRHAVILGAESVTCYDVKGFLSRLYATHGFTEIERHAWNDHLAPQNWCYERWGRPDYIVMQRR